MRYVYFTLLGLFIASCSSEIKDYPPYRVEQLNELEQEKLMKELLDHMQVEAEKSIEASCKEFMHTSCCSIMEVRNGFQVRINSQGKILIREELGTLEEIPEAILRYYTINFILNENQVARKIADANYEGYNYPFYSFVTKAQVERNIAYEKELLQTTYEAEDYDFADFHEKAIADWQKKLNCMELMGTETLKEIHQQAHIEISNHHDSVGFSDAGKQGLKGMYLVRDFASREYFSSAYIDLYYRSTRLNDFESKQQLKAIELLYPLRIWDEEYMNSKSIYNYQLAEFAPVPPQFE